MDTDSPTTLEEEPRALDAGVFGPGLVAAGWILVGRGEVLEQLARARRGVAAETAAWAARTAWEQLLVEAVVMGVVAASVAFAAGPGRRSLGVLLAAAILFSGLSGWPVAKAVNTPIFEGCLSLGALSLGGALALSLVAWLRETRPRLGSLLERPLVVLVLGVAGLGLPLFGTVAKARKPPRMPVREVVRVLLDKQAGFEVVTQRADAPPSIGVMSPFTDITLSNDEFDTGDKPALLMPPPCEVSFRVAQDEGDLALVTAAQIDQAVSRRGFGESPGDRPALLERANVESVAVRFEVLVDGQTVFDETLRHKPGEDGSARQWRHVGTAGKLVLNPGAQVTLRTSFADQATEKFFGEHPFVVGFGDLVLERWHARPRKRAAPTAPNLLVIVMDTLRADRMSCYGYEKPTTPNIDSLARRGVLFESAFASASWTWPSTASIFTGLLPYEHGVLSNAACNLGLSFETVAEVLQLQGYSTAAVSCNPLINRATHFDQGFEHFDEGVRMRMTEEVIEDVEGLLGRLSDTRFYLYLHLVDPHTPHQPLESQLKRLGAEAPEDYPDEEKFGVIIDGLDHYAKKLASGAGRDALGEVHPEKVIPASHRRWLSDRYDASVATGDLFVGRILKRLEELGLFETTIVVFTSDHGEELLDHRGLAHGHGLWRELVHVPLIFAGPGLQQGQRVAVEVSNRHLGPTLAMLGGTELAGAKGAINLLAPDLAASDVFYSTSKGTWKGASNLELLGRRSGDWVTHYAPRGAAFGEEASPEGDARLFSIQDDPLEQDDLILDPVGRPQAAFEVQALLESRKEQLERPRGVSIGVGRGGAQLLIGVGYVEQGGEPDAKQREELNDGEK